MNRILLILACASFATPAFARPGGSAAGSSSGTTTTTTTTTSAAGSSGSSGSTKSASSSATIPACKASDPATWATKQAGDHTCMDGETQTTYADFVGASWHPDSAARHAHWGCGADETKHDESAYSYRTGSCTDAATAKADNAAMATSAHADFAYDAVKALGCEKVKVPDPKNPGKTLTIVDCTRIANLETRVDRIEEGMGDVVSVLADTTQLAQAAVPQANFDAMMHQVAATDVEQNQRLDEDEEKLQDLRDDVGIAWEEIRDVQKDVGWLTWIAESGFLVYAAPSWSTLIGGDARMAQSAELAGSTLSYSQRGGVGLDLGLGYAVPNRFGIALGGVGGGVGSGTASVEGAAYVDLFYPYRKGGIEVDGGLRMAMVFAGDQENTADFANATSTISGEGGGAVLKVVGGQRIIRWQAEAWAVVGKGRQDFVEPIDEETGSNRLSGLGIQQLGVSFGGRFGGGVTNPRDVDHDHDGFTMRQGDPNDRNADVFPEPD